MGQLELELEVAHRQSRVLVVMQRGRPQDSVYVEVGADYDQLRVRYWDYPLHVQYHGKWRLWARLVLNGQIRKSLHLGL